MYIMNATDEKRQLEKKTVPNDPKWGYVMYMC